MSNEFKICTVLKDSSVTYSGDSVNPNQLKPEAYLHYFIGGCPPDGFFINCNMVQLGIKSIQGVICQLQEVLQGQSRGVLLGRLWGAMRL